MSKPDPPGGSLHPPLPRHNPTTAASHSTRRSQWAATMEGSRSPSGLVVAHGGSSRQRMDRDPAATRHLSLATGAPSMSVDGASVVGIDPRPMDRIRREQSEDATMAPGATRAIGGGRRSMPEEPDPWRTCFERDRDRILHATAFRRLAGKTQVFVHPADHQRTRLTHALEVAQVATAVSRAVGLNTTLVEAMALGHDCGHGPGGHASEDAFEVFVADFHHARWGADVVLAPLNLCAETLDGIRHHSWSLPAPATPEGELLSWADRIAYCTHDLEDAVRAGIVDDDDLPDDVVGVVGRHRSVQLRSFIDALVGGVLEHGVVGMAPEPASALAALRAFNYERIYTRPASIAQADAVVAVLRALVEHFAEHPERLPDGVRHPERLTDGVEPRVGSTSTVVLDVPHSPLHQAVAYVAGMTDRFAFATAVDQLGWDPSRLPVAVDARPAGITWAGGPSASGTGPLR